MELTNLEQTVGQLLVKLNFIQHLCRCCINVSVNKVECLSSMLGLLLITFRLQMLSAKEYRVLYFFVPLKTRLRLRRSLDQFLHLLLPKQRDNSKLILQLFLFIDSFIKTRRVRYTTIEKAHLKHFCQYSFFLSYRDNLWTLQIVLYQGLIYKKTSFHLEGQNKI